LCVGFDVHNQVIKINQEINKLIKKMHELKHERLKHLQFQSRLYNG